MTKPAAEKPPPYRELSPSRLLRNGSRLQQACLFGGWLVLIALCIWLGVGMVVWGWSGIPFEFGGVAVYLTVYPPLLICLLLTLTLGWWWGAVPAYFATLSLALYAGMPLFWALLFALSNPLGFAVMVIGYRATAMRRDLRGVSDLLFYVQQSFVACVFSSSGALIWSYTNGYDRTALLPVWQGWWLGAFMQSVFIVGPLMAALWPRVQRWQTAHPRLMRDGHIRSRKSLLGLLACVTFGVLVYGYATTGLAEAQVNLDALRQTMWIFYWVFVVIVLFMAFFGYQLFLHWQKSQDGLLAELQKLATTDALTGLLNRREADRRMEAEWQRTRRSGRSTAMVLLDIDHFKHVNDHYGHPAGDAALRRLAGVMRTEMRAVDFAGRYGGEEFLIVLPETGMRGAHAFAERLRQEVAAAVVKHDHVSFQMQISLGVAIVRDDDANFERWFARADQALYRAKQGGRNRIELDQSTVEKLA
ncbi:diguanylate cyclase [Pseudoduganella sp. FT55W]|uniref:diguanylate cyclase n=1 Tax=Duganella rivi TaxID=2666083 RepID=A0A7X4GUL7_9BURK|nr:diguanylate cyclase [Duganella rivi]MYM68894.1 diguanylate cyclase [Duganella rivi]